VSDVHCFPKLVRVFERLPATNLTDGHDASDEGAAGFSPPCDATGQGARCLEGSRILQIQFLLQSCKSELASAGIFRRVLQRKRSDLFDQLLSFYFHQNPFFLNF
jgi:hypothetical protein